MLYLFKGSYSIDSKFMVNFPEQERRGGIGSNCVSVALVVVNFRSINFCLVMATSVKSSDLS